MNDFCFYTIYKGERFKRASEMCKMSFLKHNDIDFKVFEAEGEWFKDKKYPDDNILFYKFAIAPKYLAGYKYICFVDADTLCLKKLPLDYIRKVLDNKRICVSTDPKLELRIGELERSKYGFPRDGVYFNSGVVFWNNSDTDIFIDLFYKWVIDNYKEIRVATKFGDQTWLNMFLNKHYDFREKLYQLGYWWNFRGLEKDDRAYIWHPGGRGSEGIEKMTEEVAKWE